MLYKNILFYNGNFYCEKKYIQTNYTHNRLKDQNYIFKPLNIENIDTNNIQKLDIILIILDHFHFNPAHNLWDHMYPSWYKLFKNLHNFHNNKFQFIVKKQLDNTFGIQHIDLIEKFSGYKPITIKDFSNKYNKIVSIKYLITGLEDIGISHIYKNNLNIKTGIELNNLDPIETFVNRIYDRYNIQRNSLHNIENLAKCNNIIYIKNKRSIKGMEELFIKMNKKYANKYNFKIMDYSKYNFKEQLEILNNTCICIVGVGSARFNTPFLPNGAIEIQTLQPTIHRKNNIEYIDCYGGTLSKYIKVKNIPFYTFEEAKTNYCSYLLEKYIIEALNELPCEIPVNLENNIPPEILNLRNHKDYNKKFNFWREFGHNGGPSNNIDELINILNL
jgi:hypothetical protein